MNRDSDVYRDGVAIVLAIRRGNMEAAFELYGQQEDAERLHLLITLLASWLGQMVQAYIDARDGNVTAEQVLEAFALDIASGGEEP